MTALHFILTVTGAVYISNMIVRFVVWLDTPRKH